jgi:CheY-like chemotaxis protein
VITDLGMPYVDGRKVAVAIKRESAATPVILLTGWGQRLEAEGDMPASVDFVLAKPPKIAELRASWQKSVRSPNDTSLMCRAGLQARLAPRFRQCLFQ